MFTGTRKRTPVTNVNAGPPEARAYMFPIMLIVKALIAKTTSEWLNIYIVIRHFIGNEQLGRMK